MSANLPPGYEPYVRPIGFLNLIGPVYRRIDNGTEWYGLRLEAQHANQGPMAHGGLMASLADIILGRAAIVASTPKRGCLTVSLSIDYLDSAPLGSWLEGMATIERAGRNLSFASCRLLADGKPVASGRAVLKLLPTPTTAPAPSATSQPANPPRTQDE